MYMWESMDNNVEDNILLCSGDTLQQWWYLTASMKTLGGRGLTIFHHGRDENRTNKDEKLLELFNNNKPFTLASFDERKIKLCFRKSTKQDEEKSHLVENNWRKKRIKSCLYGVTKRDLFWEN